MAWLVVRGIERDGQKRSHRPECMNNAQACVDTPPSISSLTFLSSHRRHAPACVRGVSVGQRAGGGSRGMGSKPNTLRPWRDPFRGRCLHVILHLYQLNAAGQPTAVKKFVSKTAALLSHTGGHPWRSLTMLQVQRRKFIGSCWESAARSDGTWYPLASCLTHTPIQQEPRAMVWLT